MKSLASIFTALAALCGWGLLTYGAASWSGVVWLYPISAGVLLLGLAGWRLELQILLDGLLVLTTEDAEDGEPDPERGP